MSYAVRRIVDPSTAPISSGEPPPTTATVLDYICLFTHDLRRKQKRWQDGKLKYHTFNKRIMVYDDRGNFIGDAHWHGGGDLDEGEELELDRGAAIVQVADCVGSREQDLTEVLDKRVREVEKRRAVAAAKTPTSSRATVQPQQQEHFQLNHRPLSSLVDSPGPIGRAAISTRSPYEARKAVGTPDGPPAKKRRVSPSPPSKAGFAQNLFGAKLNLSAGSVGLSSLRMRALREKTNLQREDDDQGKEKMAEEEDDDVVILDERRSKVVVRKAKYFNDAQERADPMVKGSRQVNGELSSRAGSMTMDEVASAEERQQPKPLIQGTRRINQEPLLKSLSETREERQSRHEALPQDIDDSQLRATSKSRTERPPPIKSVGQDENPQMVKAATVHDTVPRTAAHTTARKATPGPSVVETPVVEIVHVVTKPLKNMVHSESREGSHDAENTLTTSKPRKGMVRDERKKSRQTATEDVVTASEPQKIMAHDEPKRKKRQVDVENIVTISKLSPKAPARKTEKRTELRIKSRQRRGLLMISERKQEHQSHSASVTPTSSVHIADVRPTESVARSESPVTQPPEEEFLEEPNAEASMMESVLRPESPMLDLPEEECLEVHDAQVSRPDGVMRSESPILQSAQEDLLAELSAAESVEQIAEQQTIKATPEPSPPHSPEAVQIGSDSERDVAATKAKPSKSLNTNSGSASEPDEVILRSRKRQKRSPETLSKNESPSDEESNDSPPRPRRRVTKMASKGQSDSSLDRESSNNLPRNKRRQTSGKMLSELSSSESLSEEDSDEMPAKRTKRTRGQRSILNREDEPADEPRGPRITKMARKSVKCKEIFGFVPPVCEEELVPAPFAMATARIGTVGRPPAALTRLPGVTLTRKPSVPAPEPEASAGPSEKKSTEVTKVSSPRETIPEVILDDSTSMKAITAPSLIEDNMKHLVEQAPEQLSHKESAPLESAPINPIAQDTTIAERITAPKPTIVNPATRGRKAARKQDAAGQVPQAIVPFEAPQPARPPRAKPADPKKSDGSLPGFTSANGGAWSKHAEDLLGMTRPGSRKG